jgi:hypothetical protein
MKTRTKNRSCGAKKRYDDKKSANDAIRSLVRAKKASPGWMHSYSCDHCGSYHIGHRGVRR